MWERVKGMLSSCIGIVLGIVSTLGLYRGCMSGGCMSGGSLGGCTFGDVVLGMYFWGCTLGCIGGILGGMCTCAYE